MFSYEWVKNNEEDFLVLLCQGLLVSFVIAAVALLSGIQAPYGRYAKQGWGFLIDGKVAWIVQEAPNLVVVYWLYFHVEGDVRAKSSLVNRILLGMFTYHYIYRTCIFPLRLRGGKKTAFAPFFMAFTFCLINGYMQGRALTYFYVYEEGWLYTPNFIAGFTLFCIGWFINFYHDSVLINLRKPGETGYKIPERGLFRYISGANFFGEIVEWLGFAIACSNLPAATFAFTTAMNIGPRAIQHHQWYLQKFDDSPADRKALIPFIW